MDVLRDVDVNLENLHKCIATSECESLLFSLQMKYSKILAQIQEKAITFRRDRLRKVLLPEDIPLSMNTSELIVYQSPGNGDCLFNSCSCFLVGDDSLSSCLWLLTAIEIETNREYYAKETKIEEAVCTNARCNVTRYSETTLFSLCLARLGPSNLKDKANPVTTVVEEAQGKCELWHKIFFQNFSVT